MKNHMLIVSYQPFIDLDEGAHRDVRLAAKILIDMCGRGPVQSGRRFVTRQDLVEEIQIRCPRIPNPSATVDELQKQRAVVTLYQPIGYAFPRLWAQRLIKKGRNKGKLRSIS